MKILTFLLLLFTLTAGAQTAITVTVKDAENNSALPFATVIAHNKNFIADVDGKVIVTDPGNSFTVTYTGYKQQKVIVTSSRKFYTIKLAPLPEVLKEVVINATNPANELMGRAIRRKLLTDPQRKLESFKYKTYDRLVVTANPDSISGKLVSVFAYEKLGKRFQKLDSTIFKFKKIIDRQHLYQTEKVSEFKFNRNQGLKEEVLATRMAGFKQPLYEFIGLNLQSYSVYTDKIEILKLNMQAPLQMMPCWNTILKYSIRLP